MGKYKNKIPTVDEDEQTEEAKKVEKTESVVSNDTGDDYTEKKAVYFAFIDILGFKKAFDDNRIKQTSEFAEKFRNVFNYFFELMNAANLMIDKDSYAGQTSDSLYFYTTRSELLLEFLQIFLHFNLYAMTQDVFFRGGVAKGNLFSKTKYQFYGESVIYAYLLESVIAKNPVIYIDENTYFELKKCEGYVNVIQAEKERYYLKPFAGYGIDVRQFMAEDSIINIRETPLDIIRKNIEDNKRAFEYDSKNFEKYVFLIKELERC